jgi:hypothetical protein
MRRPRQKAKTKIKTIFKSKTKSKTFGSKGHGVLGEVQVNALSLVFLENS